ncbi:hypothetical protein [Streptomyces sp. enrichment culture]|uniref:hypothetical protein n=1 Tax=Streptomyces sp. enrichment culture TaxID=1795815 RepID=UPI003F55572F
MSTPTPTAPAAPAAPTPTAPPSSEPVAPPAPAAPAPTAPTFQAPAPQQPTAPPQQGEPQQPPQQGEPQDVASLPQWAQDEIREARAEAAKYRQRAKEAQQSAEPAPVAEGDVSRLPQWAQRAITTGQDATRQLTTVRAMITAAPVVGADTVALLDSQSAMTALAQVDPGDAEAVKAAITTAVQANPRLAAQPGPARAGAEFTRPAAERQPDNLTDAIAAQMGG